MRCAFCDGKQEQHSSPGFTYLLTNDVTNNWSQVSWCQEHVENLKTRFLQHSCSVNPLINACATNGGFMVLVECSFNALLLWVTVLFPRLHRPNGKIAPPLVDLSILLLRQRDQCHGNLDWLDVGRRWVCGRRPPCLTLSGTRCLGQVLIFGQVELLSEHEHVKDSNRRTLNLKKKRRLFKSSIHTYNAE